MENESQRKASGPRLERARIAAGYRTEIEFSQLHGIPQATYHHHESGKRGLKLEVAEKYAKLLGNCDAAWLLTGAGKEPAPQPRQDSALKQTSIPADTDLPGNNVRFDHARGLDETWRNKPMVPVMGTGQGGDDGFFDLNLGEPVDWVKRPPGATGSKVYCIYLEGDSMEPRFDAGDPLFVDPVKKPLPGRDVVIQMKPRQDGDAIKAFVKQVVSINSDFVEVRQFNPPKKWKIKRSDILSIHAILNRSDMY